MFSVNSLMATKLVTLSPGEPLKTAKELMYKHRIRHIPVVTESMELLGIISQRDVLKASISTFSDIDPETKDQIDAGISAAEIMNSEITTIGPKASLKEAAALMLEKRIGCLPVIEKSKLIGLLTMADFLRFSIQIIDRIEKSEFA